MRKTTIRDIARATGFSVSEAAVVEVSVPERLTLPELPPKPDVHLSDLKPVSASTGWGRIGKDASCEGNPLRVAGETYAKGMGVHAHAELVYAVEKDFKRFVAVVGLDDEESGDERASVVFEVYFDRVEMGETATLVAKSPTLKRRTIGQWRFDVAVPEGTKQVRLVATDAGDGVACDHADWVDAGFVR